MVDAMIWLIIGTLMLTTTIQSIQQYRTAAIIYQMKNDIRHAADLAAARAILSGFISEDEVSYSVENSEKSDGVTMSWAKFDVTDEDPNNISSGDASQTEPQASGSNAMMGGAAFTRASAVSSANILNIPVVEPVEIPEHVVVDKTFVLVTRHEEAPNIRVFYFFDDIYVYQKGAEDFPVEALPPVQDMPASPSSTPPPTNEPEPSPTHEHEDEESVSDPEPTPEPTATEETIPSPEPTPEHTEEAPSAPSPSAEPTPSPSPTLTEDPTPEPNPLTPEDNKDPKTQKFLFCHHGEMHSNSFKGMVEGHEHHSEDIMPPIPPRDYPGYNWNYQTAKIYYNNCKPL